MYNRATSALSQVSERIRCSAGLANVITPDPMVMVAGMSRSGTTLLTTVLDAHPEIACGAELIPSPMSSIRDVREALNGAMGVTGDFSEVGRYLRQSGNREIGLFFVRCYRAGVTSSELQEALKTLETKLPNGATRLGERILVAQTIMQHRARREDAAIYGFKYTSSAPDIAHAYLPGARLLGIIRDPFDVVLSHKKREFDKTIEDVAKTWVAYAKKYREDEASHPDTCRVLRYEDLTRQPRRTLSRAFDILPVDLHQEIFDFYKSDSSIHAGFHPNAERLRMNFSTDGIGRGKTELPARERNQIEAICRDEMREFGYDNDARIRRKGRARSGLIHVSGSERKLKALQFSRKRKFAEEDYAALLAPYTDSYEIMPIGEYVRQEEVGDRSILMIRHDVDHDIDTAVRIAKWEADRGIRATYCLLHTSWYYGKLDGDRYQHTDLLVDSIERIVGLGHEVNFHNNLITVALTTGNNPARILENELAFYDSLGVSVTGTSTHGDALCRELNYRNWELFQECCDERFGGARTIENNVDGKRFKSDVGKRSMYEFGLEYEAYDMGKDRYHTESGGNMRTRESTKGRRSFGRHEQTRGSVCGVLTHPIWWKFN